MGFNDMIIQKLLAKFIKKGIVNATDMKSTSVKIQDIHVDRFQDEGQPKSIRVEAKIIMEVTQDELLDLIDSKI